MQVSELMQQEVVSVSADATLGEAIVLMADAHVSGLPVVSDSGQIVGVIAASDVLSAEAESTTAESRETLFQATMVKEVMTAAPQVIEPEADIREAARRMLYAEVHRLFVTSESRLVGVLSATDIVRGVATRQV